jgi:tetratricopeptide (TPR) repeat protein
MVMTLFLHSKHWLALRIKFAIALTLTGLACSTLGRDAFGQDGTATASPASTSAEKSEPELSDPAAIADFDKAMDLKIEAAGDLDKLSNVVELLESALKKGLAEDDSAIARQLLGATSLERAKVQIEEMIKSRMNESMARRVQKRVIQELETATKYDPKLGEAYLLIAKLSAGTDSEKARKALNQAIENLEREPEKRGEAYTVRALLQESFDDKITDLKSALRDLPENLEIQRSLFALLLDKERFQEVYEVGKELLETNSKNPLALQATVSSLIELDRRDDAIQLLNERVEADPMEKAALVLRGNLQLTADKFDEALADGTKLLEIDKAELDGYFIRAKAYMQRAATKTAAGEDAEDLRLARRDIEAALDLKPNSAEGIRLRAAVSSQQKLYDEAIQDTTLLAKNNPQEPLWLEHLATLYQLDDRPSLAVKISDQLIALDRKNWKAYRIRGDARLSIKHMKQDQEDRSGLLNNLAWLLATSTDDSLRNGEESIRLGKEACEITAYKQAHILSTLAAGYAEVGNFEEAIKWSSKAVEVGSDEGNEQLEQLKNELKAYEDKKPWREKQEVKEKKPPVINPENAIDT